MIFVAATTVDSVKLNCNFKYKTWPVIGHVYGCHIQNLNVTQPNDLTTVILGKHHTSLNQSNFDVRAFDVTKQTCLYLPGRVKNFFMNLELLNVVNSKLQSISAADLKPFTKLRVLMLSANNLVDLDNDLFDNNPELVRVDFRDQKFKLIGYNFLENVPKLSIADFTNAGCIDFKAENGKKGVKELKREIRINCQPIDEFFFEFRKINDKLNNIDTTKMNSGRSEGKSEDLSKISAIVDQLQRDHQKCNENFDIFMRDYNDMKRKLEVLEKVITTNASNCEYCENEVTELKKIKRELSSIELKCEIPIGNTKICAVKNLRILKSDIEISFVNVGIHPKNLIESIEDFRAMNQQIFYLPVNLNRMFPNLKSLNIIESKVSELGPDPLKQMTKLMNLILSHNSISNVHKESFKNLIMLEMLDLSFNNLDYIQPSTFDNLQKLSTLKLDNNRLQLLTDETFSKLINLQNLFLQSNKLQKISPLTFENLKNLNFIDLTSNDCVSHSESSKDSQSINLSILKSYFAVRC